MTEVVFYDFGFNRIMDFSQPLSVNIERCYCGFGCAELHFAITEHRLIQLLEANEYLFFITNEACAIVTGWQLGEDIAIYGRTPEWLLTKRGVRPLSFSNTNAEVIARNVVGGVSGFVSLGELSGVGTAIKYSTEEVRSLYDVVCEVLKLQGLGFEVYPDIQNRQFVFRVYEGQESLCMFSPSNRTAYNVLYSVEKQDAATNSGWYERRYKDMGGWNAATNTPGLSNNQSSNAYTFYRVTSSQTTSRFDLSCVQGAYLYCDNAQGKWKISDKKPSTIWLYVDNPDATGLEKWDAILSGIKTVDEAKAEISRLQRSNNTSCEVYRFEYGRDYCLGDVVRTQIEFGEFKKSERKRVASVVVYSDTDKSGASPILESLEE